MKQYYRNNTTDTTLQTHLGKIDHNMNSPASTQVLGTGELLIMILSNLGCKDLVRLRQVQKFWQNVIQDEKPLRELTWKVGRPASKSDSLFETPAWLADLRRQIDEVGQTSGAWNDPQNQLLHDIKHYLEIGDTYLSWFLRLTRTAIPKGTPGDARKAIVRGVFRPGSLLRKIMRDHRCTKCMNLSGPHDDLRIEKAHPILRPLFSSCSSPVFICVQGRGGNVVVTLGMREQQNEFKEFCHRLFQIYKVARSSRLQIDMALNPVCTYLRVHYHAEFECELDYPSGLTVGQAVAHIAKVCKGTRRCAIEQNALLESILNDEYPKKLSGLI
jgi:hypothetical protein